MSSHPQLRVDFASHEAATYAVEHWHYSRKMPHGKLVNIGAWEDGRFIGAVVYGAGANHNIGSPFGLEPTQVCELVRVALRKHGTPTSRIIAISMKFLRGIARGLRLVVSYADTGQGHHGGIYQAGNWLYLGAIEQDVYRIHGEYFHKRVIAHVARRSGGDESMAWLHTHMDPNAERVPDCVKHKYVLPLDAEMMAQLRPLAKPYPKRPTCAGSNDSVAPGLQPGEGGANPTSALFMKRPLFG